MDRADGRTRTPRAAPPTAIPIGATLALAFIVDRMLV